MHIDLKYFNICIQQIESMGIEINKSVRSKKKTNINPIRAKSHFNGFRNDAMILDRFNSFS